MASIIPELLPSRVVQRAAILGGPNTRIGARLDKHHDHRCVESSQITPASPINDESSLEDSIDAPLVEDTFSSNEKHRTCHWVETAFLIMAEFIGFSILGFPPAYATMGWVFGILATLFMGVCCLYTSLVLWELCLRHPEIKSICDIGKILCGKYGTYGLWFTTFMFVSNNIWVQSIHVNLGGKFLQEVFKEKSVDFCPQILGSIVTASLCLLCSLPRTLRVLSRFAIAAVIFTIVCLILSMVFIVEQGGPIDISAQSQNGTVISIAEPNTVVFSPWPAPDSTFRDIMVAFLGIAFAFVGQMTLPSFIAEMRDPREFPKALYLSSAVQYTLFITFSLFMYSYIGFQDMTSITVASLEMPKLIMSFSFLLPSIIVLGALYAAVTGRFIISLILSRNSNRRTTDLTWTSLISLLWVLALVISQTIPEFDALLAVVGAVFDAFFGWIYWGFAWFRMRQADIRSKTPRVWGPKTDIVLGVTNASLILLGVGLFLVAGSWASFSYIGENFSMESAGRPFQCST